MKVELEELKRREKLMQCPDPAPGAEEMLAQVRRWNVRHSTGPSQGVSWLRGYDVGAQSQCESTAVQVWWRAHEDTGKAVYLGH